VTRYDASLTALAERGRFGVRLGLGRVRALLRELGDPQLHLRGALVGGTNGKGSVLALAAGALRAAGLRVGETPKPHLVSYRERLQVDGRPIGREAFADLIEAVLPAAAAIERRLGPATEFELLTAAIFRWFAAADLDVALVEVGLGGRLDATNAWDGGVAAITNVDLDHTDRLGSTIAAIAREKAAIVKRGDVALTGAAGDGLAVIRRRAARLRVPLVVVEPAPLVGWDRDGIEVELARLGRVRVGLRGRHQAANVAVADALLDALEVAGIAVVGASARRAGYAAARWPGRLELVEVAGGSGGRTIEVLLDGAHNPAAAASLARALDDLRPFLAGGAGAGAPPLTLVVGAMADKDLDGVVAALAASPAVAGARIVATAVADLRARSPEAVAARWAALGGAAGLTVEMIAEPKAALARALETAPGPVVVTGSLYLVGAVRAELVEDPSTRDPEAPAAR
jgi:dihydrofolate synthase/folylpolyglutamate synthase